MQLPNKFRNSPIAFVVWTAIAAFLTYSAMYAFRKPLSAGTFEGMELWGISYKVILIVTQVLGYLFSKFIGIKVISELPKERRFVMLIGLISASEIALLLFAITPYPYGFIWMFFNGLPLGLIWGIVFSYLEGRRFTDILATFLSISFIVSSGVVKTVGRILIEEVGVNEFWMPATVGLIFFPLLWIASKVLNETPEPSEEDKQLRTERLPVNKSERKKILAKYTFGLSAILLVNFVMTIGRDIKDNFLVEIWQGIGIETTPYIYSQLDSVIGIIVLLLLAFLVFVKNNRKAFSILHLNILGGLVMVLISTILYQNEMLDAVWWMILHGVGLYLSYIALQSLYFERFIASFQVKGNVGFLIYLSDFIGYLGSCLILIIKEIFGIRLDWTTFFIYLTYVVVIVGIAGTVSAQLYFSIKHKSIIKNLIKK